MPEQLGWVRGKAAEEREWRLGGQPSYLHVEMPSQLRYEESYGLKTLSLDCQCFQPSHSELPLLVCCVRMSYPGMTSQGLQCSQPSCLEVLTLQLRSEELGWSETLSKGYRCSQSRYLELPSLVWCSRLVYAGQTGMFSLKCLYSQLRYLELASLESCEQVGFPEVFSQGCWHPQPRYLELPLLMCCSPV